MKKNAIAALTLFLATMSGQQGNIVPAPTSPVTGNAVNGKALYYTYGCYACHGYNGETGARAFVGHWGHLATEQAFVTFLRGRANVAPVSSIHVHAEFRRSIPARQEGQGYLRLHPDVEKLGARFERYSNTERHRGVGE